jgi:hypothetical protein
MDTKQLSRIFGLVMLAAILLGSTSYADEITFKDENIAKLGTVLKMDTESVTIRFPRESIQTVIMGRKGVSSSQKADEITFEDENIAKLGTVLKIDTENVTIRFPRESIESIVTSQEGLSSPQEKEGLMAVPLAAPQPQEGIKKHEQNVKEEKKVGGSGTPDSSKISSAHEQLLQEEMGRVQGVILWQGKPLSNGQAKIVLEKYTGFSMASLKRMFEKEEGKPLQEGITLVAKTDSQGRYAFSKVPPGYYRLYWLPQGGSDWYRRFRDRPDFEVISGQLTIQDIPEKKK